MKIPLCTAAAVLSLFAAGSAAAEDRNAPADPIQLLAITPGSPAQVRTAANRTTTLLLPFRVKDMQGVGFSRDQVSADFLCSVKDSTVTIAPTKGGISRNLNVTAENGAIYTFEVIAGDIQTAAFVVHCAVKVQPTVQRAALEPFRLMTIPTAEKRTTTLVFPFKIKDVQGVGFSRADENSDFVCTVSPGASTMSISPTKSGVRRNLNIMAENGSLYAFDVVEGDSQKAAYVMYFAEGK